MMLPTPYSRGKRVALRAAIFTFFAAGGILAQPAAATPESIPAEPFAAESSAPAEPAAASSGGVDAAFASGAPAEATAEFEPAPGPENPDSGGRKSFSLWDIFSRFFELGSPGDPNHPDKLRLTIGTAIGYDDNVFTTNTDRIASGTAGLNGTLAYNFGTERLKIASSLALGTTYYDNRPGDDTDYNGTFSLATSYYVTRRLQISANASVAYLSQPNPTLIGGVSRFSGDYTATNLGLGLNYTLRPRLSLRLQYGINSIAYTEESQNQGLGFTEQNYILGLDYLLTPRLTLTSEFRYNPLSYDASDQDSVGQIFTLGFIASFSPKLRWTLQGGVETREFQNTNDASTSASNDASSRYIGPFLETDLEYDFSPGSSLVGSLRYGTEPSGSAGISIRETLRGALNFRYAFGGRLSADVGLSYQHDRYDQPGDISDYEQEYYTGTLGLRYQFNPSISLTTRYDYSMVTSQDEINDYTRSVTTLGLEIIF